MSKAQSKKQRTLKHQLLFHRSLGSKLKPVYGQVLLDQDSLTSGMALVPGPERENYRVVKVNDQWKRQE